MFLCACSPVQPAELFPVLCFKAGVCVIHSKWHMCALSCFRLFSGRSVAQTKPWSLPQTPDPHPGSYHVSTHLRLLKMPVLCHNEESVNLFTYALCSSLFLRANNTWTFLNLSWPDDDFETFVYRSRPDI